MRKAPASVALRLATISFPVLQARHPNAALVLGHFWDVVLGTPPQSLSDANALSAALMELVRAPELDSSMMLLLNGLQSRVAEPLVASRWACPGGFSC